VENAFVMSLGRAFGRHKGVVKRLKDARITCLGDWGAVSSSPLAPFFMGRGAFLCFALTLLGKKGFLVDGDVASVVA
jgi:hypothetical protein